MAVHTNNLSTQRLRQKDFVLEEQTWATVQTHLKEKRDM